MYSRLDCARELGRRVSRGEFERIFSKTFKAALRTFKRGFALDANGKWVLEADGSRKLVLYHPSMFVMHPQSPKFRRKHGDTLTQKKSRRARVEHAFK